MNPFYHIIYFLLLVGILVPADNIFAQNKTQALMITNKIGWLIDTIERKEYRLFPEYENENFEYAQFKDSAGIIYYEIYSETGKVYRNQITKRGFKALRKSIKNKKGIYYKVIYDSIVPYSRKDRKFYMRYQRRKLNTQIRSTTDAAYNGQIFYVNDSLCVLFKEKLRNKILFKNSNNTGEEPVVITYEQLRNEKNDLKEKKD